MANLKEFYNALKADGAPVPSTYEEFEGYMTSGPNNGYTHRKQVYDALKADGAPVPDTYEAFRDALFKARTPATNRAAALPQQTNSPKGTAQVARLVGTTLAQLGQEKPATGEAWKPTEREEAMMEARGQAVLGDFKANTDAMQQHFRDKTEYYEGGKWMTGAPVKGKMTVNPKTGNFEQTYLTPEGKTTTDRGTAERETREYNISSAYARSIVGQLAEARRELEDLKLQRKTHLDEIQANQESHWYDALGGAYGSRREQLPYDASASGYDAAIRAAEERVQLLENRHDQMTKGDSFWRDYGRGTIQAVADVSAWDFGATDFANSMTYRRIKEKIDEGIELSEGEKAAMESYILTEGVRESLGDMGRGYRWGNITGTSLSFMKDFILTGGYAGISGITTKGLAKGAVALGGSVARKKLAREVAGKGLLGFVRDNGARGLLDLTKEQGLRCM